MRKVLLTLGALALIGGGILLSKQDYSETTCITIKSKYIDRGNYIVETDSGAYKVQCNFTDVQANGNDWSNLSIGKTYTIVRNIYGTYSILEIKNESCVE